MGKPIFQRQILVMVVALSCFSPFPRFIHFALFIEIASPPPSQHPSLQHLNFLPPQKKVPLLPHLKKQQISQTK